MKIVESLTWIEGIIQIELLWGSLSSLGNAPLLVYLSVTLASLIGLVMMMTFMLIHDHHHDHDHGDDDDDNDGDDDEK